MISTRARQVSLDLDPLALLFALIRGDDIDWEGIIILELCVMLLAKTVSDVVTAGVRCGSHGARVGGHLTLLP